MIAGSGVGLAEIERRIEEDDIGTSIFQGMKERQRIAHIGYRLEHAGGRESREPGPATMRVAAVRVLVASCCATKRVCRAEKTVSISEIIILSGTESNTRS